MGGGSSFGLFLGGVGKDSHFLDTKQKKGLAYFTKSAKLNLCTKHPFCFMNKKKRRRVSCLYGSHPFGWDGGGGVLVGMEPQCDDMIFHRNYTFPCLIKVCVHNYSQPAEPNGTKTQDKTHTHTTQHTHNSHTHTQTNNNRKENALLLHALLDNIPLPLIS